MQFFKNVYLGDLDIEVEFDKEDVITFLKDEDDPDLIEDILKEVPDPFELPLPKESGFSG